MKKFITFIVCVSLFCVNIFAETKPIKPTKGNGSIISPFKIENLAHLRWLSEGDENTTDNSRWKDNYILTSDIDASETSEWNDGLGFLPIGESTGSFILRDGFEGRFDGNHYSIYNLTINNPSQDGVGLFVSVNWENSKILNLGLQDVTVIGDSYVGGLAGMCSSGEIINCFTTGSISSTGDEVGGLVGKNIGIIKYCHSEASVIGNSYVGGLVGRNYESLYACYTNSNVDGDEMCGGLIGGNFGGVLSSYSLGNVNGTLYIGGLIGYDNNGQVKKCYSSGLVTAEIYLGGLIGNSLFGEISESYSNCIVNGGSGVGGLIGANHSQINNCFSSGNISGESHLGGLIAENHDDVENCYAIGNIAINDIDQAENIGGLIGYDSFGEVIHSYWDINTTGQESSINIDSIYGLKTDDFSESSSFDEWDFNSIWKISIIENISEFPRPYLSWQYQHSISIISTFEDLVEDNTFYNTITSEIGTDTLIEFIPEQGYFLHNVFIDGVNMGNISSYLFEDISKNHIINVYYQKGTSINTNLLDQINVNLYPNPNNGVFYISDSEINESNICIFNSQGIKIFETNSNSNRNVFDIKNQPVGIYYIKIEYDNSYLTKKIIKTE